MKLVEPFCHDRDKWFKRTHEVESLIFEEYEQP